jgi:hypothetical protein
MLVFVLNKHSKPLMSCSPRKARKLLEEGSTKVIRRTPFTVKLLYGTSAYKPAFTLHREDYTCQSNLDAKPANKLHVRRIIFKLQGGSNTPSNLITLCDDCHDALHNGKFELKTKLSITKHATQMKSINSALAWYWDFQPAFGYETKFKREQILKLPKTHYYDAWAICYEESQALTTLAKVLIKKHLAKGGYQQTKGAHSQKILPTGKLFGLRNFDLINTDKGLGFVPGKRPSGYFALMDILGTKICASVNIKKNMVRITSRTTTLTQLMEAAIPLGYTGPSFLAKN